MAGLDRTNLLDSTSFLYFVTRQRHGPILLSRQMLRTFHAQCVERSLLKYNKGTQYRGVLRSFDTRRMSHLPYNYVCKSKCRWAENIMRRQDDRWRRARDNVKRRRGKSPSRAGGSTLRPSISPGAFLLGEDHISP